MKFDKIVFFGLTVIVGTFMYVKVDKNMEEHNNKIIENQKVESNLNNSFLSAIGSAKDKLNNFTKGFLETKPREEVKIELKQEKEPGIIIKNKVPFECLTNTIKVNCYLRGDFKKGQSIRYLFTTIEKDFDKYEKEIVLEKDQKELVFSRIKLNRETPWKLEIFIDNNMVKSENINVKGLKNETK